MNAVRTELGLVPDHVCIGVPDLNEAVAWYQRVLGFEVDVQWTVPELPGFRLAYIRNGNWRIELIDTGDAQAEPVKPMAFDQFLRIRGFSHVCFRVEDVDAAAGEIRRRGVDFELEPTDFPNVGRRVAFFRDLFGNLKREWDEIVTPLTEGEPRVHIETGLETWFSIAGLGVTSPPPRWKMALVTWVAIYPTITILLLGAGEALGRLPVALRTLLLTGLLVPLMTFVLLPLLTRAARSWLYP